MIIGISGGAGAGKDTFADILVKNHMFVKVSLADPLKRICRDVFEFSIEQLWGPSEKRNTSDFRYPREHTWIPRMDPRYPSCSCCGVVWNGQKQPQCYLTPRYALQQLGTEWGRNCYQNVWVDHLVRSAEKMTKGGFNYIQATGLFPTFDLWEDTGPSHVVVPDVRFENEISALKAAGAKLVRITRPGTNLVGDHSSEREQMEISDSVFDVVVRNEGYVSDLERHAEELAR